MAGEWIKMRGDLLDDPTVDRLAEILEVDVLTMVGALFCFWVWADKYSVDGHVDGATSRLVDKVSHKEGFCAAMVSVGWLVVTDSGLDMPKFDRHNGQTAKERSLKNQRQARWREGKSVDDKPSTQPSTREEKRREDINTTPNGVVATKRPSKKCPADFEVTAQLMAWAETECPGFAWDRATAKFRDHTFKNPITDWPATWRNWIRSDFERATPVAASAKNTSKYAGAAKAIWGNDESRTINA